jgi:hypothetical protein
MEQLRNGRVCRYLPGHNRKGRLPLAARFSCAELVKRGYTWYCWSCSTAWQEQPTESCCAKPMWRLVRWDSNEHAVNFARLGAANDNG